MLLCTSVIDQFTRGIFSSKHKVVSWYSHPVVILSTSRHQRPRSLQEPAPIRKNRLTEQVEESLNPICLAQQFFFQPNTLPSALVTISAFGIHTVKLRCLEKSKQKMFAAYDVIEKHSRQQFCTSVYIFSTKSVH